jgi:DNA polymerase-1
LGRAPEGSQGALQGDFQSFDAELVKYAEQDIHVTRALYHYVEPKVRDWGCSVELEHKVAYIIGLQEQNGFKLNLNKARILEGRAPAGTERHRAGATGDLPADHGGPEDQGHGAGHAEGVQPEEPATRGCPYSRVKVEEFNPGSEMQIERGCG